jgi:exosortase/archaeosortase family protein
MLSLKHLVAAVGFVLALLPSLRWYVARLGDGNDERLGLAVLVVALVLGWRDRAQVRTTLSGAVLGLGLLICSGLLQGQVPPMIAAGVGIAAVASYGGLWRMPGVVGLLFLSLPVVASLQFYFGYPLQLVTAMSADFILSAGGIGVDRVGVQLFTNGTTVGVEPACSGVKMLWAGAVYAGMTAGVLRLRWGKSMLVGLAAFALVLGANVLRATALVLPESGVFSVSKTAHEMVGLGCFFGAVLMITWIANARGSQAVRVRVSERKGRL